MYESTEHLHRNHLLLKLGGALLVTTLMAVNVTTHSRLNEMFRYSNSIIIKKQARPKSKEGALLNLKHIDINYMCLRRIFHILDGTRMCFALFFK